MLVRQLEDEVVKAKTHASQTNPEVRKNKIAHFPFLVKEKLHLIVVGAGESSLGSSASGERPSDPWDRHPQGDRQGRPLSVPFLFRTLVKLARIPSRCKISWRWMFSWAARQNSNREYTIWTLSPANSCWEVASCDVKGHIRGRLSLRCERARVIEIHHKQE